MADEKDLELDELEEPAGAQPPPAEDEGIDPADLGADFGDFPRGSQDLEAVYDIPVQVSAVLGKASMEVSQLLKLGRGAVVEDRLGVTMTEIIKSERT